jgi:Rod binding domain-containing protein
MTSLPPITRTAPTAPGFVAPSFGRGLTGQRTFAEALGNVHRSNSLDAQESRTPEARAREAAELLVSSTLVEPILKQARENNNAAPPFGPTQAEKQFGGILDHRLAHEMVSGSNFPLVDRLARDLLNRARITA